ncbi:sodium:proton antiporter [Microbacterium sp. EYE_5]|uniref:cation:proton antiporter n=1 Tax=unclassified Microbacterium TaxID=2609290 RepID=UPI002005197F|nr:MULTISPECIES: sodium:proton antiporter [unclassified Microbacterium]MCK6080412.1 sodium:proton antiporter [Microbacterium sp. EYE_382]MCK6085683.1 sodium:proton antiporter [Microbacterium sp. EYE_384]MCK6124819.1 sodium:proton antiporter [Microbacterium sp. EYE_80]MCK6127728.1 sodium:proton antiporter [Microbacterium sp. EYE_79]MCK6141367.1 sodium:proton antiporter [Microbacterium sp. EYE_39]
MIETLVVLVVGLLLVAASAVIAPKLGLAAPVLLVGLGVLGSLLPFFTDFELNPEWILLGILPPLLYSAAVSMPAMHFRREFAAIGGLSVFLVVATSLVLGAFFMLVLPGVDFAWGVALGAIVSPTDAVATSIIKRTPVSKRVVAILEGESLLNDATALVLLRTAIVAAAASFSVWGAVGTFAYSVALAVALGALVGWLNLRIRRRVTDPTVNTVISFAAPFVAAIPAELLEASGLVAAVVAGIVTGIGAPRQFSAQNRLSDAQNWRTVELVLEGAVFLLMGLQLTTILDDVEAAHEGVRSALLIALGAWALTLVVRAAYVAPLLGLLRVRGRRARRLQPRLETLQERLDAAGDESEVLDAFARRGRTMSSGQLSRFTRRVTQGLADIRYFLAAPLGWREGTVVVWAGMRGAITLAAAQTLPPGAPQRSVLILVAFAVAALSLVVQGSTVAPLVRRLSSDDDTAESARRDAAERREVRNVLRRSADGVPAPDRPEGASREELGDIARRHRLAVLAAQRAALLDARDDGVFDADILAHELAGLDATQIAIELRRGGD